MVEFDFDYHILPYVKSLPDREYIGKEQVWTLPQTSFHARLLLKALERFHFTVDPTIGELAAGSTRRPQFTTKMIERKLPGIRPYQVKAIQFADAHSGRVLIGDDMGVGKTLEAMGYMSMIREDRGLIVAPSSVIYKWRDEIATWLHRPADVIDELETPLAPQDNLLVTTYTMMTMREREFIDWKPTTLVFDEAHYISHRSAQRSQAAKRIARMALHILPLSGSPFLNRVSELWSILNILDPDAWPNNHRFLQRYSHSNPQYTGMPDNKEELVERLADVMIRRTKMEIAAYLPKLNPRAKVTVRLDPSIQKQYDAARRDLLSWLHKNGMPVERATRAEALVKLNVLRHLSGLGKVPVALDWARDFLDADPDAKLVVYALHRDVVESLVQGLKKYGVVSIVGDVSTKQRYTNQQEFQTGRPRVMVISKAGGEGIDLYRASNILFVERAWNPMTEEQAESRLHRTGQTVPVTSWLLNGSPTDSKIDRLIDTKREVFSGVIGQDDIGSVVMEMLRMEMDE